MNSVVFRKDHWDFILPYLREEERLDVPLDQLEFLANNGQCATMIHEGRALCLFGFMQLHPGVLYVHVIPTEWIRHSLSYKKVFLKTIKTYVKNLQSMPIHRLETNALANEMHDSWMQHLGFKCEGTLEQYSPNRVDYRKWAWVKDR